MQSRQVFIRVCLNTLKHSNGAIETVLIKNIQIRQLKIRFKIEYNLFQMYLRYKIRKKKQEKGRGRFALKIEIPQLTEFN